MSYAIIFDMDGLLVDSEVLWTQVERELLATRGATFREEIARKHMGVRLDEAVAVMLREYRLDEEPESFTTALVEGVLRAFASSLEMMPGAKECVDEALSLGIPIAIASSSPTQVVAWVVDHYGWRSHLAAVCAGDEAEVARGKPAPDIFLLAAARMGVEPSDCIVLEDSVNGARAALAAGTYCIAVPNPIYSPSEFEGIADRIVSSLEEVDIREVIGSSEGARAQQGERHAA